MRERVHPKEMVKVVHGLAQLSTSAGLRGFLPSLRVLEVLADGIDEGSVSGEARYQVTYDDLATTLWSVAKIAREERRALESGSRGSGDATGSEAEERRARVAVAFSGLLETYLQRHKCVLSPSLSPSLSLSLSLSMSDVRRPGRTRKKRPNDGKIYMNAVALTHLFADLCVRLCVRFHRYTDPLSILMVIESLRDFGHWPETQVLQVLVHKVETSRDHFQARDLAWMVVTLCEVAAAAAAAAADNGARGSVVGSQEKGCLRDLAMLLAQDGGHQRGTGGG